MTGRQSIDANAGINGDGAAASFEDRVRRVLYDVLATDPDRRADHAYLVQDLGADSLDVVEFSFELEEEFELGFDELDLSKAITVRDVIEAVQQAVDVDAAQADSR